MNKLSVTHHGGTYPIIVKKGIRFDLHSYIEKSYSKILIVTDGHVAKLYLEDVKRSLSTIPLTSFVIPAGEKSKSIDIYYQVQTKAIEEGLDRNSLIIALGGGVVGDLAGFVAATFMRGIDYIQMPTTILAHDSSVGGKVAINHPLGKNLIGAFYPPVGVFYDTETLESLPEREVRSGYAELVKEALISDEALFNNMLKTPIKSLSMDELSSFIMAGIKVKQKIVQADEFEHGIRSYLNLGHTLAHALEAEYGYDEVTHGEAVAIGLLFSMHASENIFRVELPFEKLKNWLNENDYPLAGLPMDSDRLIGHMKSDKKAVNQVIKMVVLQAPGKLELREIDDVTLKDLLESFKERLM